MSSLISLPTHPPFLDGDAFRHLVPMEAAVAAVREAFVAVADGTDVDQPPRIVSDDGDALAMLARLRPDGDTVFKAVTVTPGNRGSDLSTIQSVVAVFDGTNGAPVLLLDGQAVTAVRTGAASGVATDALAARAGSVLAVIGSGAQAADQIDGVCAVRFISEIRLASRNKRTCEVLADRIVRERPTVRVTVVDSPQEVVATADIICCATTSTEPLFGIEDINPDVHINAIGAYTPWMCELDPSLLAAARLIAVDQKSAALAEAGDLIRAIDSGAINADRLCEIGSIIAEGQGRTEGLTVFKSVGIGAQDWAVATLARQRLISSVEGRETRELLQQ